MTRFSFLAWAATTIGAAVSIAAPTTAPSQTPAANADAGQASYSSVLVLPFAPVAGASAWIGRAIQEDLATELTRHTRLDVILPADAQAVSDAAAAAKIGHDRGASLVAFGTYQMVDSTLRMNGELIDTSSGKPLVALKTTGPERALFPMEDRLAAQAIASLPPGLIKPSDGYASTPSTSPSANNADAPYNSQGFYVTPGPDYVPTYDYTGGSAPAAAYNSGYAPSPYPDDYPWYDYDYPFLGDGFFFIDRFRDHRHDHDRDGRWNSGGDSHIPQSSSGNGVKSAPTFHNSTGHDGSHTAGSYRGGEGHR